jgi:multidrug efflux system outer membrane protein
VDIERCISSMRRARALPAGGFMLLVACTSCTLGPDYTRPPVATPASWSSAAAASTQDALPSRVTASASDGDSWWTVFDDPVLTHLIETAARQNLDIQQAVLRIAAARAQRDATASALYPNVDGSGIAGRARMSQNGITQALSGGQAASAADQSAAPPSSFNLFQAGFDATWELDLFGKVRRNVQAADAEVRSAEAANRDSLVSLSAEIARTYTALRGSQAQRDIALADVHAQEHLVKLVASRNRVGLAASSDVATQLVQVSAARASVPQSEQAIALNMNRLALLLALPPGAVSGMMGESSIPALPPEVPVGLPADLLRRRPDIREREADLQAATARIGVAKAALFPSIKLGLTGGLQSTTMSELLDWSSRFMIGGAQVSIPLFSGGKLRAQVRIADLAEKQAVLAYRESVLNAFHDVDNTLIAYAADQRRALDIRHQVEGAERSRALTQARYESGLAAFIDVLDAEHQCHQAELDMAEIRVTTSTDLIALYKALGGGWDSRQTAMR